MRERINKLLRRLEEVEELLSLPETVSDLKKYRALTQEHSYLFSIKESASALERAEKELAQSSELLKAEKDSDFAEIVREEIAELEKQVVEETRKLENLLVPPDPRDNRNILLEIRAGTGGDEAALFVGDCVRMYRNYAIKKGWSTEVLSSSPSDLGGFREYIIALSGPNVFRLMQYEAGTHRVQRVPATETQGRIHTSAVTVAVLLEPDEETDVHIDEKDLKIDTYRASGAGGQHVNVTDSAVRITHLPTGIVVQCQDERSQHKNKDKAMRHLRAKMVEEIERKKQAEMASIRLSQVGSGDRSERIRTYNFPQNRVTDHRINLTLFKLDQVMEGEIDEFTETLVTFYYQEKLRGEEAS